MSIERRSILKSTAAAIAVAIPGAITGCVPPVIAGPSGQDAELRRLGAEFDRAHAAWVPRWQEWQRIEREWRSTLDAKGMSFAEHGVDAVCSIFTELGGDDASDANDAALKWVEAVADQIRSLRATTIAGIAVKARVACFDAVPMHQIVKPMDKRDHAPQAVIALLAEIVAVARASA